MLPILVVVGLLAMPIALIPGHARADAIPAVVGLVIDYGDGAFSYATVPLPSDGAPMDGVALLEQSGLPVLTISFGGYGAGICKIEMTGCEIDACRARLCQTADSRSPFWRYLLSGPEGWVMSPLGASGTTVEAGKVYAWAWAGGTGVPATPLLSLDDVKSLSGFVMSDTPRVALRSVGLPEVTPEGSHATDYSVATGLLIVVGGCGALIVWRTRTRRADGTETPC